MLDYDTWQEIQDERRLQAALRDHKDRVEAMRPRVYDEFLSGRRDDEFLNNWIDTRTAGRILRALATLGKLDPDDMNELQLAADDMIDDIAKLRAAR